MIMSFFLAILIIYSFLAIGKKKSISLDKLMEKAKEKNLNSSKIKQDQKDGADANEKKSSRHSSPRTGKLIIHSANDKKSFDNETQKNQSNQNFQILHDGTSPKEKLRSTSSPQLQRKSQRLEK